MPGTILLGVDVEMADASSANYATLGVELMGQLGIQCTWYVTGRALENFPQQFQQADKSGAVDIQVHTFDHLLYKSVLMQVPAGKVIHGSKDWFFKPAAAPAELDVDLRRCLRVYENLFSRPARGLTTPWAYYRGLGDRPDLLAMIHAHGIRFVRSYGRDERDGQPVPLEVQPYFYKPQGFPTVLELGIQDYQDDFYYAAFNGLPDASTYPAHLRLVADRVAAEGLTWSLCSHDHSCQTPEAFAAKTSWIVEIVNYAKSLGIRFMTGSDYYRQTIERE